MRILTAQEARTSVFDCDAWTSREPTASRAEISSAFVHDVYQSHARTGFEEAAEALLTYRIFPPRRMRAVVCTLDRRVALGATIIQRAFLGPVAVECAVRVIEFESSAGRVAFTYATLTGHPARGIESFSVTRAGNQTNLEIQGWSRSGHWLTMIGRPVARALQVAMTREAIAAFPRA